MKKPHPLIETFLILLVAASLPFIPSCAHKLAPTGVYAGDKVLFEADQTLTTGYDLLDAFVKWEKDFRPMLQGTPEIKQAADKIRRNAPDWFRTGFKLRDAYAANPGESNRTAVATSISVIRAALAESAFYLAKYGPQKKE